MKAFGSMQLSPPVGRVSAGIGNGLSITAHQKMSGATEPHLGMILKKADLGGKFAWHPFVIGIKERDQIPLRQLQRSIPGRRCPLVRGEARDFEIREDGRRQLERGVGRGIIPEDHFQIPDPLRLHALQCTSDAMGAVVDWDDDADQHDEQKIGR